MLFVYIVACFSGLLFALSLQSIKAGFFSFLILLCSCDLAVRMSNQDRYVGPIYIATSIYKAIDTLTHDMAVAEQKAAEYDRCMDYFLNKAYADAQAIPSHKSLHHQCLKVAAERSLP